MILLIGKYRSSNFCLFGTGFVDFGDDFFLVGEPPRRCSSFSDDVADDWRRRKAGGSCCGGQETITQRNGIEIAALVVVFASPETVTVARFWDGDDYSSRPEVDPVSTRV